MKIYKVDGIHGSTLVRARSKPAAIKAVLQNVRANTVASLATPDAIYSAGQRGVAIIDAAANPETSSEETGNG